MNNEIILLSWGCILLGFLMGKLQVKYLKSGRATKINFRLISAGAFAFYAIGVFLIISYTVNKYF